MVEVSVPKIFWYRLHHNPSLVSFVLLLYGKSQLETETKQQEGEFATCPLAFTGRGFLLYALLMRSRRLLKRWFESRIGGCSYNGSFSKTAYPYLFLLC